MLAEWLEDVLIMRSTEFPAIQVFLEATGGHLLLGFTRRHKPLLPSPKGVSSGPISHQTGKQLIIFTKTNFKPVCVWGWIQLRP
ncbi:hypothetical protein J6590_016985 [Homalodisca vitripennis]|nr:hypothetical protein J6590_016985 [Homalodisca vitripennis]